MDEGAVVDALNAALRLQYRSGLAYTFVAGSLVGFQFAGLSTELYRFAAAELADARHLVEKVVTLGGEATIDVAPLERHGRAESMVGWLVESETETIEALQDCIPLTGQEGRSEALEHRLEHMIMRKQEQVDLLIRAGREAG
jgi:bacterioferritin (cytochrome b1)